MSMLPTPKKARDIGQCIYCGSSGDLLDELSREHALPFGLGGTWTLLRASCDSCARITSRFEADTLKCLYHEIRTVFDMPTRNRKDRPTTLPLTVGIDDPRIMQVPLADFPLYLPTLLLPPPGVIAGRQPVPGIFPTELKLIHIAGPSHEDLCRRYKTDFVGTHLKFSPVMFAQTLAKIAFCMGVYALGLAAFKHSPIRRIILGEDPCIGHWVGSWNLGAFNELKGNHIVEVCATGTDIHVTLRPFAQFGAPTYQVVLGPADPNFVNSAAWPASWTVPPR